MKKILSIVLFCVFFLSAACSVAAVTSDPTLLVDDAGLLSTSEEKDLLDLLSEISEKNKLNVAVVTVNTLGRKSARTFADDYFDENGYGYGDSEDGVLLLIAMREREWYITTAGRAIRIFTDAGLDYIGDRVADSLSDGEYAEGFETFADLCDDYIAQAKSGAPYDYGNLPKGSFPLGKYLLISAVIGIAVGFVSVCVMASKLKTVRATAGASSYTKAGSFRVTEQRDLYLYRTVSSTPRADTSHSGGGSSTHHSSSGVSHGGRGGRF